MSARAAGCAAAEEAVCVNSCLEIEGGSPHGCGASAASMGNSRRASFPKFSAPQGDGVKSARFPLEISHLPNIPICELASAKKALRSSVRVLGLTMVSWHFLEDAVLCDAPHRLGYSWATLSSVWPRLWWPHSVMPARTAAELCNRNHRLPVAV